MKRLALLGLLLAAPAHAQYLDGLPAASSVSGSDIIPVCQGGTAGAPGTCVTRRATASQLPFSGVAALTGGTINGVSIGAVTPSTGAFSALSASGSVSGAGFTSLLAPYLTTASAAATYAPLVSPTFNSIATTGNATVGGTLAVTVGVQVGSLASGYMDVTAQAGVDPTGATDSSTGFNAALATGKTVHIPCGVYHLAKMVTVGTTVGQRLYGDGLCTQITVGSDLASSANAVFQIATDPSYNTHISDLQITFSQPPDLLLTAASAAAAGATTITMTSVAGVVVGQNVVDNTTGSAIPTLNAVTSMTTVTAINGSVITLSQPITGAGVKAGDTLAFAATRAQFVSLPNCTMTAGAGGCKYPPAIRGINIKRPRIENIRINGAWDGIYLYADAEAYVDSIEVGAFRYGVFVDFFTDNGFINRVKYAPFFGISGALSWVTQDGQSSCLTAGRTDGGLFSQFACFNAGISLLSTFTSGIFSDIYVDGVNAAFTIAAGTPNADVKITNLHVDTNGTPPGVCMLDIGSGNVTVSNSYLWAQSGAESGLCVRGGVVQFTGGQIVVQSSTANDVNQSGGELSLTGVLLRSSNGLSVPAIKQTAGVYHYIANTMGASLLGGVTAIQTADASDPTDSIIANATGGHAIVWPGQNPITPGVLGSPWHYTAPSNGTLILSGGTVSNITITRGGTTIQTGVTAGSFSMALSDIIAVTYSAAPTMTFLPQ